MTLKEALQTNLNIKLPEETVYTKQPLDRKYSKNEITRTDWEVETPTQIPIAAYVIDVDGKPFILGV